MITNTNMHPQIQCCDYKKRLNLQSDSTLIYWIHPQIQCCEWKKTESLVWQYFDYKCPSQNSMLWVKKTGSTVWQCFDQCCLLYWKSFAHKKFSRILIKEHLYLQRTVCCNDCTWNREELFPILGVLRSKLLTISSTATDPYFPHSNWFPIFTGIDFLFIALQPFNDWCQLSHVRIAQTDNQYLWIFFFTHHTKQTERTFLTLYQWNATVFMIVYNNA